MSDYKSKAEQTLSQTASHKMNLSSGSRGQARPRLLELPVELQLEIISHLPHDQHPSRACLRRTHSSFLQLVPKSDIRSKISELQLYNQLLRTELDYTYLLPPDHYPCFFCARVLPIYAFVDTVTNISAYDSFTRHRCCCDCRLRNLGNYCSRVLSTMWIAWTLEELPMPPSPPRLYLRTATTVSLRSDELDQRLRKLEERVQRICAAQEKDVGRPCWREKSQLHECGAQV